MKQTAKDKVVIYVVNGTEKPLKWDGTTPLDIERRQVMPFIVMLILVATFCAAGLLIGIVQ